MSTANPIGAWVTSGIGARHAYSVSEASRGWFFNGLLTQSRSEPDGALLLMRFSLASLPIGAIVMLACLFWFGADVAHDIDDLAISFVQSSLVP